MYNLCSRLSSLAKGAFLKCADPLYGASLPLNSAVCRALSCTAARRQESAPTVDPSEKTSKEFSFYPPMPGHESSLRWGGKKFEELPIVHIKATYNNTHIQVTDNTGKSMIRTSCGAEGFRNVKKSTPVAAQTAGISAAAKAQGKGVSCVRVVLKGLGQGRMAAMRGLTMGGLEIVSITDNTPVPHNGCRPRKARRM
ncbi:28S ribosomal protein S11, mitochondrial [Brienomyrus brachyistius]|uniref:28S ribosomal protein S11, mitochondrial n=1 Tax=Brienomyrus brachyistius TaxID=42636 RepID=UPI0020B2D7C9|nr:28S ribosomal protein S11, mitochondrial [Brienomyrus brachyistius]